MVKKHFSKCSILLLIPSEFSRTQTYVDIRFSISTRNAISLWSHASCDVIVSNWHCSDARKKNRKIPHPHPQIRPFSQYDPLPISTSGLTTKLLLDEGEGESYICLGQCNNQPRLALADLLEDVEAIVGGLRSSVAPTISPLWPMTMTNTATTVV